MKLERSWWRKNKDALRFGFLSREAMKKAVFSELDELHVVSPDATKSENV